MNPLLQLSSLSSLTIILRLYQYSEDFLDTRDYILEEQAWISSGVLPKLNFLSMCLEVACVGVDLNPLMKELTNLRQDLMDGSISQRTRKGEGHDDQFEAFKVVD